MKVLFTYLDYADATVQCECGQELVLNASDDDRGEQRACACGRVYKLAVHINVEQAGVSAVMRFESRPDGRQVGVFVWEGVEYEVPADGTILVGDPPGRSLAQLVEQRVAVPRPHRDARPHRVDSHLAEGIKRDMEQANQERWQDGTA